MTENDFTKSRKSEMISGSLSGVSQNHCLNLKPSSSQYTHPIRYKMEVAGENPVVSISKYKTFSLDTSGIPKNV